MNKKNSFICRLLLLLLALPNITFAQGDGPRSQLLLPTGVNVVAPAYIHLSGNYNFGENILVQGADIKSDILVITYTRAFSLADHYAQVWINPVFGKVDGNGTVTNQTTGGATTLEADVSGLGDLLVNFKFGLIGSPALNLTDFAKHEQTFQVSFFGSISAPIGDYESDRFLNLGTNVWSFRVGVPTVLPFSIANKPTFLEVFPSIAIYTDNDDPTLDSNTREQDPLFMVENHLTHNVTSKLWAGIDLRYRYGGETTTDGVNDVNKQNVLGGGFSFGYTFTPALSMQASYGLVLIGDDDSELDLFRVKLAYLF